MRKLLVALSVVCLSGIAMGQCAPGSWQFGYDDEGAETSWKISNPSGPNDWFNVDYDMDMMGWVGIQLMAQFLENAGTPTPGQMINHGLYPEHATFVNTPDIANPILTVNATVPAGSTPGTWHCYPINYTFGSTDVHQATQMVPGDSHIWLSSDTNGPIANRSFFSSTGYATPATPFTLNWLLRVGLIPPGPCCANQNGLLLVNGQMTTFTTPVNLTQLNDTFCLTFYGCNPSAAGGAQFLLYLVFGPLWFKIGLPFLFTNTSCPYFPGPIDTAWTICTAVTCDFPTTSTLDFTTIYEDYCDTKANGSAKLKIGTHAFVHFQPNDNCEETPCACFGIMDDCVVDNNIWKVSSPAGTCDWFNVNHGTCPTSTAITAITDLEISSWDFCGFGPAWAEIGVYPANLGLDPQGCTPNITAPYTNLLAAPIPPGSSNGNCPWVQYILPPYSVNTTEHFHAAVHWPPADTCIWLGSDTDGTDTTLGCAPVIPSTGCESLWTLDCYTTSGNRFSGANWCIQISWQ